MLLDVKYHDLPVCLQGTYLVPLRSNNFFHSTASYGDSEVMVSNMFITYHPET